MPHAAVHRVTGTPPPRMLMLQEQTRPNFDAAFIERRMQEHRELQERAAADLAADIVTEVASAIEATLDRAFALRKPSRAEGA